MARSQKIDCKKPELVGGHPYLCKWCGRPCKFDYLGKLVHLRGYKRMHGDPRKEEAARKQGGTEP